MHLLTKFSYFFILEIKANYVIGLISLIFWCSILVFTETVEEPTKSFDYCWQSNLQNASTQPLFAQSNRIFVSMADGSLVSVNAINGSALWRADLGGTIVSQSVASNNTVFVASQATTFDKNKTPIIIVRALSANTGVTIWQKEFPAATKVSLIFQNNFLVIALGEENNNQKIHALNGEDGQILWSQKIALQMTTGLTAHQNFFYFATTNNLLWIYKLTDGTILKSLQLPHAANNRIVINDNLIFFSDTTGYVSAIREIDQKMLWTLRLGGSAQDILLINDKILLSSFDDFIYFHKITSGKRLWRKRLAGRPLGVAALSDSTIGLTVSGESSGTIINLKNGKSIDLLDFGTNNTALGAPLLTTNYLVILTENGLRGFAGNSGACQKAEKKADNN
jgi:outer membrane protein assembly factor BamB